MVNGSTSRRQAFQGVSFGFHTKWMEGVKRSPHGVDLLKTVKARCLVEAGIVSVSLVRGRSEGTESAPPSNRIYKDEARGYYSSSSNGEI
jgi:hypothetical protein